MSDRIDRPDDRPPRGPWPEATDASRVYDHGRGWCVNAGAHPDNNDGYPDPDRHLPWHECRSAEVFVESAIRAVDGDPIGICAYLAAPFRFGQPRNDLEAPPARIVIESWALDADDASQRIGLSAGSALQLAQILSWLAEELTLPWPAAR